MSTVELIPKAYKLSSGFEIPSVGFGSYEISASETEKVVFEALKAGFRHIDTAVLYGNEHEVGQGIMRWLNEDPENNRRKDVFYTTKLWNSQNGYEKAKRAIDSCLDKVQGIGYIDLLLIHSPLSGQTKRLETYRAMQEAVAEGKVRSIGVSNYGIKHIDELLNWKDLKVKPVVNQIEISPWLMRQELADYCKSKDILVEAYAPLTHGYKLDDPELLKVAQEVERNPGQVLIRWSLQKGYIPLPKTRSIKRIPGNIDVYSFTLSDEQIARLDRPNAYEPTDWECTDAP